MATTRANPQVALGQQGRALGRLHRARAALPLLVASFGALALPAQAHAAVLEVGTGAYAHLLELHALVAPNAPEPCGSGLGHLGALAVIALLVIAALRFRHSTARQRLELARRMVEQGMEPPAELLTPQRRNDLRRGLVLVAAGAGLLLYGWISHPGSPSAAGLIPGFIGLGYMLSHKFASS